MAVMSESDIRLIIGKERGMPERPATLLLMT